MNPSLYIGLISTGLLVGLLLTAHLQTDVSPASSFPLDEFETQKELVKSYLDEQAFLKSKLASLRIELNKIRESNRSLQSIQDLQLLQDLKRELGLTDVEGPGVVVELKDSDKVQRDRDVNADGLIHAADLRDIINALRSVGVTAISVNDQRIVLNTSINGVGNTILINNTNMLPPFTIEAVGPTEAILSKLTSVQALPDLYKRVEEQGLNLKIASRDYLHVPFYTGSFPVEHIKND